MFRRVHNRFFTFLNNYTVDLSSSNESPDINLMSALSPRPWNSLPSRKITGSVLSTPLSDYDETCDIDNLFSDFNSSLGCNVMTNPSTSVSRPHSRPDSPDFGCSTPIASLAHQGYSSCEEDEEDDDDEDDDVYLENEDNLRGQVGVLSVRDDGGAESSSCSDSLMSPPTSSSRNQVSTGYGFYCQYLSFDSD